jgi:hypothetical protein
MMLDYETSHLFLFGVLLCFFSHGGGLRGLYLDQSQRIALSILISMTIAVSRSSTLCFLAYSIGQLPLSVCELLIL